LGDAADEEQLEVAEMLIEVGRDYVARTSDRLRNQYVAAETKKLG
jgi:hypothetical protein